MDDPIQRLRQLWDLAKSHPSLKHKSAICVSTIDSHGFPDGRFVDLKQVEHSGIVFCSSYQSEKGHAIAKNNKVALTAWWEPVGYQIRIQGYAKKISTALADKYWQTRNHSAHIISSFLQQSEPVESQQDMMAMYSAAQHATANEEIPRPADWGGYSINPVRIEFLEFADSRLHLRENFTKLQDAWQVQILQP